jgi:hypothetical protein
LSGFYSLVQFVPVPERCEGVNVGVLLFECDQQHFNFILTRPVRRIQSLFRGISSEDIATECLSFYNQIMATQFQDLDDLTEFCLSQKGVLRCTEPKWVRVDHSTFSVVIQDLLSTLVL